MVDFYGNVQTITFHYEFCQGGGTFKDINFKFAPDYTQKYKTNMYRKFSVILS